MADESSVSAADAYEAWGQAAYPVLIAVAHEYDAYITYHDLGRKVQADTGIQTRQLLHFWIGKVLRHVVLEAHRRGDAPLTALVVDADERVGDGYKLVLELAGEPAIDDEAEREKHAARARLLCYRRYCPSLPADGGRPALTPKVAARARAKTRATEPVPVPCPACHLQLPMSGICDTCG